MSAPDLQASLHCIDSSTLQWLPYTALTPLHYCNSSTQLWLLHCYCHWLLWLLLPLTALTAIAIDCSEPVILPSPLSCYRPMPMTVSQDTRTLLEEKWIWSIITHIILFNVEQINIMLFICTGFESIVFHRTWKVHELQPRFSCRYITVKAGYHNNVTLP